jgi:hypothetical protein
MSPIPITIQFNMGVKVFTTKDTKDHEENPGHAAFVILSVLAGKLTIQNSSLYKIKGRPEPAFAINLRHPNYFLGAIASLAALATRNLTTVFALI